MKKKIKSVKIKKEKMKPKKGVKAETGEKRKIKGAKTKKGKSKRVGCGPIALAMLFLSGVAVWDEIKASRDGTWTIVPIEKEKTKVELKIDKRGNTVTIANGSFVIVYGNWQDFEKGKEYFGYAMSEEGDYTGGTIDGEYLGEEAIQIQGSELVRYDIYEVNATTSNVLEGVMENDNILGSVEKGEYVLAYEPITEESDGEMQPTIAILSDGRLVRGHIAEGDLKKVKVLEKEDIKIENQEKIPVAQVDTSKDGGVNLNLRPEPGSTEKIIGIPNGSNVELMGEKAQKGEKTWVKVRYTDQNGKIYEGWVVEEYLINLEQDKFDETISLNDISLNEEGTASGIDVSGASANQLRKMIENGIPDTIKTSDYKEKEINISKRSGDVNFVYIKLGASGYGTGKLDIIENYNQYIEQVKVCEEKQIPYGFYYYSTAITKEEAEAEARNIKKVIKELKSKYDLKFNILDKVVDCEIANEEDRHYDEPRNQVSEAKAHLINLLMEDGSGVTIYIAPRAYSSRVAERIIDMKVLREALNEPDKVTIWICSSVNAKGKDSSKLAAYEKELTDMGLRIIARQYITDVTSMPGKCDLNVMDPQYLQEKINERELGSLRRQDESLCDIVVVPEDDERT